MGHSSNIQDRRSIIAGCARNRYSYTRFLLERDKYLYTKTTNTPNTNETPFQQIPSRRTSPPRLKNDRLIHTEPQTPVIQMFYALCSMLCNTIMTCIPCWYPYTLTHCRQRQNHEYSHHPPLPCLHLSIFTLPLYIQ
ncbi:hypothetical protein EYC80_001691 [Monilinia laxa]|uniref:Uncharacterized protein n=1 Tax=Monilinia laxa TaxID=61186 RepID=A0A5N6K5N6_MONLA|nr:hypothetical protein EYC80_001691 [Monilinia laxa]